MATGAVPVRLRTATHFSLENSHRETSHRGRTFRSPWAFVASSLTLNSQQFLQHLVDAGGICLAFHCLHGLSYQEAHGFFFAVVIILHRLRIRGDDFSRLLRSAPSSLTIFSPFSSTYCSGSTSSSNISSNTSFATEALMYLHRTSSISSARCSGEKRISSGSMLLFF